MIALFGVLIPWGGGYLVATAFDYETSKAVLIGVAFTATSIAITADTLREMGKLQTEAAKAIIGAAIIDDVLALMALAGRAPDGKLRRELLAFMGRVSVWRRFFILEALLTHVPASDSLVGEICLINRELHPQYADILHTFLAAFLADNYGIEISFARWMLVGVPVTLIMLPLCWLALTRLVYPISFATSPETRQHLKELKRDLGPASSAEWRVGIVFACVVVGWMTRPWLTKYLPIEGLSDPGIVMIAAFAMFLIPSGGRKTLRLLNWQQTKELPWEILILFGGGLSLAAAVSTTGLAHWLGTSLVPLGAWGIAAIVVGGTDPAALPTELRGVAHGQARGRGSRLHPVRGDDRRDRARGWSRHAGRCRIRGRL